MFTPLAGLPVDLQIYFNSQHTQKQQMKSLMDVKKSYASQLASGVSIRVTVRTWLYYTRHHVSVNKNKYMNK